MSPSSNSTSSIQNSAFKRHARYQDSEVDWLGEVPEHWDVLPGRVTLSLNKQKNAGNVEDTVPSLSYGRLVVKPPEKLTGLVPESFEGYQIINPGDIIIRPTDLQNDWTSLRVGLAKHRGIITSAYLGLKHDSKVSSEYLYYLLHSYDPLKVYYGMGSGLRQNLDWRDFKYLPLAIPPKPEQDRIVDFLDQKTSEIDALNVKKERQIQLLDEQKAIRINRAVTRGLDPTVKLKPSGIEWIGDIPEHWEVLKLRRLLVNIEQGNSPTAVQDNGEVDQWKVVTLSSVSKGAFKNDAFKPISSNVANKATNTLVDGDFLLPRANTRSLVGDTCIVQNVRIHTTFSDLVYRFTPNKRASKSYLLCYLLSKAARSQIERDARGSNETMCKVSHGHIKEWDITIPPPEEQTQIVAHLGNYQGKYETTLSSFQKHIGSLKTLRSTL